MAQEEEKNTSNSELNTLMPAFQLVQAELEKLTTPLDTQVETAPMDINFDEQMKTLQDQIDKLSADLVHREDASDDSGRLGDVVAAVRDEKKPETHSVVSAVEVAKVTKLVVVPRELQPDFTSNVQNWTDNPFNRETTQKASLWPGQKRTEKVSLVRKFAAIVEDAKVKAPVATLIKKAVPKVRAPEKTLVEKQTPVQEKLPTQKLPESAPVVLPVSPETHDTKKLDSSEVAASEKKPAAESTKRDKAETLKQPEKEPEEKQPEIATRPKLEKASIQTDMYLTGEDLRLAEKLVKESKRRQHGVAYGVLMTLGALLVLVALGLVAAWAWFGTTEVNEHMTQMRTQPITQKATSKVTLQEMLAVPAYTIRYTLVNDETSNIVELQYRDGSALTSDKSLGRAYLEKAGKLHEIDALAGESKLLTVPTPGYSRYLVLTPAHLGKLQEEGSQTAHGQLFRTEDYVNFKAFFADDQLKFVIDNNSGVEYSIREYKKEVQEDFDTLPGEKKSEETKSESTEAVKTTDEKADEKVEKVSDGAVKPATSKQVETVAVELPDENVVGEISVGQYLIFD